MIPGGSTTSTPTASGTGSRTGSTDGWSSPPPSRPSRTTSRPGGHVLDAGGGAGRYSIWLADRGYDVTMVDLSRGQLAVARERIADHGVESSVTLAQGSITDLGLSTDAFDATCCLGGPLSHVLSEPDRERAVSELRRVSVPDAPVFVSVMGLIGAIQLYLLTGHNLEALPDLLEGGDYDADLLEDALDLSAAEREALERTVGKTNGDPAVTDLSIHMLAVATA